MYVYAAATVMSCVWVFTVYYNYTYSRLLCKQLFLCAVLCVWSLNLLKYTFLCTFLEFFIFFYFIFIFNIRRDGIKCSTFI